MPALQSRRWCFTSYSDKVNIKTDNIDYIIYQHEICPTTNKQHKQGYLVTTNKCAFKTVKSYFDDEKIHIERAIGTHEQCIKYCSKTETRKPDTKPIEWGNKNCIQQGKRNDLENIITEIKSNKTIKWTDLCEKYTAVIAKYEKFVRKAADQYKCRIIEEDIGRTEMTNLIVIYGPSGTGKTTWIKQNVKDCYWKNESHKWWDGYTGQENVCINDFTNTGHIKMIDFLTICDHAPYQIETKGGMANFTSKNVYITTNLTENDMLKGLSTEHQNAIKRRWMLKKMEKQC